MTTLVEAKALSRAQRQYLAALHFQHWEGIVAATMRRYFTRQRNIIIRRLQGKEGRHGTRHWLLYGEPAGEKQINIDRVFDRARWDAELRDEFGGILVKLTTDTGQALFDAFDVSGQFNLHDPRVTEALSRRVTKVTRTNETTMSAIRRELQQGEAAGEPINALASRVRDVFSDATRTRSETIARTEVVGASNEAGYLGAQQSAEPDEDGTPGLDLLKQWLATDDDRTRETHAEADGQTVGLDESFNVGGNDCDFPGDETLPPEESVNCRCTTIYVPQ